MINIDNKTYRNLEEQVGYNTHKINELSRLRMANIDGIVPDITSLPNKKDEPDKTPDRIYYLVGTREPYSLFYRVNENWVNLGPYTFVGAQGPQGVTGAVGPQGEKGPQGERGIEGPMGRPGQTGPQGLRGLQGEQGPQGPKGDKGEEGTIFYVVTKLNSVGELPDASTVPTTNAYLVKSAHTDTKGNPIYDLYMITKQGTTQSWVNVGAMTGTNTRIIEIKAPASAKNGTLTLNQLEQIKEPVVNMIQLGESTFLPASHIQGYYLYRCLTDDKMLVLSINEANGAWTLTSYVINLPDVAIQNLREEVKKKQDILISGTNIKKIDNNDITGSGNFSLNYKQDTLVSGTNIKTVNGYSLLGEGNITIGDTVAPSALPKATTTSLGAVKVGNGLEVNSDGVLSTKDTGSITKDVICSHQYEITGNTGDEHGLAVEDQQMLIKKIEGQTKVVNGQLVNSNCVLKSTGRNLIDITKPKELSPEFTIVNDNTIRVNGAGGWALNYYYKDNFVAYSPLNQLIKITGTIDELRLISGNGILYDLPVLSNLTIGLFADISSDQKTISNIRVVIKEGPYEPYKEDTINGIGSLGQWDYDDLIAQKGIRQASDIVTLNGNENWNLDNQAPSGQRFILSDKVTNALDSDIAINLVSNKLTEASSSDIWFQSNLDNAISVQKNLIIIVKREFTSVEQLKTWLAQNPIQLVYKKATPTKVDINLPNGMAVYNGGLQSQIGDVPYKITKQYNLSQKAQTLANIEIDREQQALIDVKANQTSLDATDIKLKFVMENFYKSATKTISGTTGSVEEIGNGYFAHVSTTIIPNLDKEPKIEKITLGPTPPTIEYNRLTGECKCKIYGFSAQQTVKAKIIYEPNLLQYFESLQKITLEEAQAMQEI